jgi:hypothetical protein
MSLWIQIMRKESNSRRHKVKRSQMRTARKVKMMTSRNKTKWRSNRR